MWIFFPLRRELEILGVARQSMRVVSSIVTRTLCVLNLHVSLADGGHIMSLLVVHFPYKCL